MKRHWSGQPVVCWVGCVLNILLGGIGMVLRRSLLLLIALLLPTIAFATTTYVVKQGDNLYDLSRKFGVSVEDITELNKLKNNNLGIGDELLIPATNKHGNNNYVVKSGDTVSQIAEKFGVRTKDLKSANNLKSDRLKIGQKLYIPVQNNKSTEVVVSEDVIDVGSIEKEATQPPNVIQEEISKIYVVKKGDTLGEIAEKHNVKTLNLKKTNNLKNHNLQIGQKLTIPSEEVITSKTTNKKKETISEKSPINNKNISNSDITVSNVYIIKKGDTIYDLSNKFSISKDNLTKWNNLNNNSLSIGQKLYLTPNKQITTASNKVEKKASAPKYSSEYKVKSGDTLGHIATNHEITVKELKAANGLTNNNLSIGKVLKVPASAKTNKAKTKNAEPAPRYSKTKYIVKKGDTLGGIAQRYSVSVTGIKKASSLKNNKIKVGDVLLIPGTHKAPVAGSKYTVARGDTLSQIAAKYGVSVKDLRKANSLTSNYLYAGMKLVVPGNTVVTPKATPKTKHSAQNINTKYVVKNGDTLGSIAQANGVSATAIKNANNIKTDIIRSGQILVIPQASDYRQKSVQKAKQHPSERRAKQSIIETAKQYLGAPYKFGGYSFKTGIDCSGFVKKIFSQFNVDLPRTARDMYYRSGTRVAKSQLQTGDLVFFTTYAKFPSHIGIYMGNGQFIHASSGARKVSITSLNKDYYRKRYIGAKRIKMSAIFEDEYSQK